MDELAESMECYHVGMTIRDQGEKRIVEFMPVESMEDPRDPEAQN